MSPWIEQWREPLPEPDKKATRQRKKLVRTNTGRTETK